MDAQRLRKFAEFLHRAEYAGDGPALWVTVTYAGASDQYDEWAPVRLEDITEDGIRDPGFGSGPIAYSDVEKVTVHAVPRSAPNHVFRAESLEQYSFKYRTLCDLVEFCEGVRIDDAGITTE